MLLIEVINHLTLFCELASTEVDWALMLILNLSRVDLLLLLNSSLNSHFKSPDIDLLSKNLVRLSFPCLKSPSSLEL